jgi:hypothetical protein
MSEMVLVVVAVVHGCGCACDFCDWSFVQECNTDSLYECEYEIISGARLIDLVDNTGSFRSSLEQNLQHEIFTRVLSFGILGYILNIFAFELGQG